MSSRRLKLKRTPPPLWVRPVRLTEKNITLHSHPSPSRICRRLPPIPGPTPGPINGHLVTTDDNDSIDFPAQSGHFPSLHVHISHLDENQAGILPCHADLCEADFGIFPPTRPQIGESSCGFTC